MRFGIRTLDELDVHNKRVLCRVDINQPVDKLTGKLKSTSRIRACVPTLRELLDKRAALVVLAHQGSDIEYKNFFTTRPHAQALSELLGREVKFVDDVCGPAARDAIRALQPGEILLLDNVRFCSEEQTLFENSLKLTHEQMAKTQVVTKLAPLFDCYVCDAFAAAHRAQPSLCGFEQLLPSAMGRLFEREYCEVSALMEAPARPCVFALGGAKVADAFEMMERVLSNGSCDMILAGGLVGEILIAASGKPISRETLDYITSEGYDAHIRGSRALVEKYSDKLCLPVDFAVVSGGERREGATGAPGLAQDIGSKTAERFARHIAAAKTVFFNGPMGVFENANTEFGTARVLKAIAESGAHTVLGGGDSIAAAEKFGYINCIDYVCTGGGALIRFLTGEELPVVYALREGSML